jgi:hypothetical protein
MSREEQEMVREVFKLKLDKIDNALYVLKENTDLGQEFQNLMKQPLLDEKAKYISLQNRIINKLSN